MSYPPQGIDDDVIRKSKLSDDTWEMLITAVNTKRMRQVLRRVFRGKENQNEEE